MSRRLVDVSRYQVERPDPLDLSQAVTAGYDTVNIALTGGRGYVSGQWAADYTDRARQLGMGVMTYHWLDGRTSGAVQAAATAARLAALGGADGLAHLVDVEETGQFGIPPPTWAHVADYVHAMQDTLQRPMSIYTADYWWKPRGWDGRSLTPYLMGPPNDPTGDVADESPGWECGWGGWPTRSIMQWGVQPLPGTGNCSLSHIRYDGVWAALTGGPQVSSQAYKDWLADGQPWKYGRAVRAVGDRLRAHGYTVYFQGNDTHLQKAVPEDHTPFSATGWPGTSPYPYCMACDVMPPAAGAVSKLTGQPLPSLQRLATQIRADKISGAAGAAFLKYMNWEPTGNNTGDCWHDSWAPGYARAASTDRGHIHLSSRSDFHLSTASDGYDLVARVLGEPHMPFDNNDKAYLTGTLVPAIVKAVKATPIRATDRDLETVLSDLFSGEQADLSLIAGNSQTIRQAHLTRIEANTDALRVALIALRDAFGVLPAAVAAELAGQIPGIDPATLESAVSRATAGVLANLRIVYAAPGS